MGQKSKDIYYLDPDYENFVPRKTRLKSQSNKRRSIKYLFLTAWFAFLVYYFSVFVLSSYHVLKVTRSQDADVTDCVVLSQNSNEYHLQIEYVFRVGEGVYRGQDDFRTSVGRCSYLLRSVRIQYHVSNPNDSYIEEQVSNSTRLNGVSDFLMALICLIPLSLLALGNNLWDTINEFKLDYMYLQLRHNGVVLDGEVIDAKYEARHVKGKTYYVAAITVNFETPKGRLLTRKFTGKPEELASRELALSGTFVKILYANDSAVMML